jgi:hypothetical protein
MKNVFFKQLWDKNLFKDITGFNSWTLFGAPSGIFVTGGHSPVKQFFNLL